MGGRGLAWLWGFGGVRIDGKSVWPVKILGESVDDVEPRFKAKVLKAKRAGTTLVFTYGDDKYVWAKPKWLQPLKIRDARAALEHVPDGELIEAAIRGHRCRSAVSSTASSACDAASAVLRDDPKHEGADTKPRGPVGV